MGLKHAPGAPDVLIRENDQTLSGPVDTIHDVLHDGLAGIEVSLVVADRQWRLRGLEGGQQLGVYPGLVLLAVTEKHVKLEGLLSLDRLLDEPVVVVLEVPPLVVDDAKEDDEAGEGGGDADDEVPGRL